MQLTHAKTNVEEGQKLLDKFSQKNKEHLGGLPKDAVANENIVTVYPGGKTFSTITDAMNSITDASEKKQYQIALGPGTYNENVTMKPFTNIMGAGDDKSKIVANASGTGNSGTITGASNCGLFELTVQCDGHNWGDWVTALVLMSASPFEAQGVSFLGNGAPNVNMRTIQGLSSGTSTNIVNLGSCNIISKGDMQSTNNNGIILFQGYMFMDQCKVLATGSGDSEGVSANWGATINLLDCAVTGIAYSLNIDGAPSSMTAKNCTLQGPVSPGVHVENSQ